MAHENEFVNYAGLEVVACCVNSKFGSKAEMPNEANDKAIAVYTGDTCGCFTKGHMYQYCLDCACWTDISPSAAVDQHYDPTSVNAQSGIAVAEAIDCAQPPASANKGKNSVLTDSCWQCVEFNCSIQYGAGVWTDGECLYYDWGSWTDRTQHLVYNKACNCWEEHLWNCDIRDARAIWTDGVDIYYDDPYGTFLKYDKVNKCWEDKQWNCTILGNFIWTDGDCIYYSCVNDQYVLNKESGLWEDKMWNYAMCETAQCIWTDGNFIYYTEWASCSYVYDKAEKCWTNKAWNCSVAGGGVWTDGKDIYYSNDNGARVQYVLDKDTDCWKDKDWGSLRPYEGDMIWTDGRNIYSSHAGCTYVLCSQTCAVNAKPQMQ